MFQAEEYVIACTCISLCDAAGSIIRQATAHTSSSSRRRCCVMMDRSSCPNTGQLTADTKKTLFRKQVNMFPSQKNTVQKTGKYTSPSRKTLFRKQVNIHLLAEKHCSENRYMVPSCKTLFRQHVNIYFLSEKHC